MHRRGWTAIALSVLLPAGVAAQERPLSAIDWLDAPRPLAQLPHAPEGPPAPLDEPAVTTSGAAPPVTVRPLDTGAARPVGLVPASVTGMAADLWANSDPKDVIDLIDGLPDAELPAENALLFTLLLAEADAPQGNAAAQDALTRARGRKLMALGAVDPALSLLEQAGAATSPALFDLWAQLALLVGTEENACTALGENPRLTDNIGLRIFCDARNGAWENAALALGSAKALSLLPQETLNVLDRFLNPDLFEDAPPLPAPRRPDPLTFRLFETIGEPLPTGPLPRPFAVADLRDITGWKSQIEAAERLTRSGALPDNRLLGLYTDRRPAASGGIWDRVKAVQQFDVALGTGSADAVAKTLPPAWRAMQDAALEVSFSTAFYDRLAGMTLTGSAAVIQMHMGLLSPDYEIAARAPLVDAPPITRLARAVAGGTAEGPAPQEALPRAIFDAFTAPAPDAALVTMAKDGRLGEALLQTLGALRTGARGDTMALRQSLGTLRALGLEDTARRAALQILLTERER